MARKNNNNDDAGVRCALILVAIIFAMPLVGVYLIVKGSDNEEKGLGLTLLIVGLVLWGFILANME